MTRPTVFCREAGECQGCPPRCRRRTALCGAGGSRARWSLLVAALAWSVLPARATAQEESDPRILPPARQVSLAGPRFGLTLLSRGIVDTLASRNIDVSRVITQFGWQFEQLILPAASGAAVVTEWVLLVGGLEQSAAIPSLSWLVGLRMPGGSEFGLGPNFTPAGSGLVFAGGVTRRVGGMNVPLNVSIVPSKLGARVSVLGGFTLRSAPRRAPSFERRFPRPCISQPPVFAPPTPSVIRPGATRVHPPATQRPIQQPPIAGCRSRAGVDGG